LTTTPESIMSLSVLSDLHLKKQAGGGPIQPGMSRKVDTWSGLLTILRVIAKPETESELSWSDRAIAPIVHLGVLPSMREFSSFEKSETVSSRSFGLSRPIGVTSEDEKEFIEAVAEYRARSGRQFPTCSELLEVLKSLGYAKRIWKPVEGWESLVDVIGCQGRSTG
jgi:hypothetical protein